MDSGPGDGQPGNGRRPDGSTGQEPHDLQRYFPLVNAIARRTLRGELPAFDYSDAVATGLLALVKSGRRVDAGERGFVSYASQRVRGAILDAIRGLSYPALSSVPLGADGGRDGNGHPSALDVPDGSHYSSPEWVADRHESIRELRDAIELLCPREQEIIVLRYWREESTRSVAQRLGISPARVSQLEKRARQRLRALLSDEAGEGARAAAKGLGPHHLSAATS